MDKSEEDKKITNFGKWCRKLRIDKGWSMINVAEKLGCSQNQITQYEQGKVNPQPEFLEKCLEVYGIPESEKAEFLAQALTSSKRLIVNLDKVTIIPKDDLAKLMAVIVFNLKEPYPDTNEWKALTMAIKRLKDGIDERKLNYTVIREDEN